jgi:hypoxanthine phosphoribosyltransferase
MGDERLFVGPEEFQLDSFRLGRKIYDDSSFKPDFLVAIWRGGTPVGVYIHELLDYLKVELKHGVIKSSAYHDIELKKEIVVEGLGSIIPHLDSSTKLLLVDDVFDTGLSVQKVIDLLRERMGNNAPRQVRIATLHYKPGKNLTKLAPDYYLHEVDKDVWIFYPHELKKLSLDEIRENKGPEIAELLKP